MAPGLQLGAVGVCTQGAVGNPGGVESPRADPDSTTANVADRARSAAVTALRRVATGLLALIVALGLLGALGVRTSTATKEEAGYTLALEYPAVARAGLDVRWELHVVRPGGFDDEVTIALGADYFGIFEAQGWYPDPASQTRTADLLLLSFDPPPGDEFVLGFDAYIQPASQIGSPGSAAIWLEDREVARIDFQTRLVP